MSQWTHSVSRDPHVSRSALPGRDIAVWCPGVHRLPSFSLSFLFLSSFLTIVAYNKG